MELLTAMYTMFSGSINPVRTESTAFKLHCGATAAMLVTFSVAVTTRQYVGNPIDCIHTRDIPEDVLNTYCWIHSTFTVEGRGQEAYPGVRGAGSSDPGGSKEGRRPAKYYQWVAFMLFFQVGLFLQHTFHYHLEIDLLY